MGYETKSRVTPWEPPNGEQWFVSGADQTVKSVVRIPADRPIFPSIQETYTWVNPKEGSEEELKESARIFRNGFTSTDPRYDRGHEFWTTATHGYVSHWDAFVPRFLLSNPTLRYFYRGPLVPRFDLMTGTRVLNGVLHGNPWPAMPTDGDRGTLGAKAISNTAPTNPTSSLSVLVGELLGEGLPSAIGLTAMRTGANRFRSYGGEYLNVQFGWIPFISSLQDTIRSIRNHSRITEQLVRDSGRVVRRRFSFPDSIETSTATYRNSGAKLFGFPDRYWVPHPGESDQILKTSRTHRKVWFSGAYSYYVPAGNGVTERLERYDAMANVLLGTRVTPEVLWELAPWSWLIDWVADIGSVVSNATRLSEDGLVLRYGYLMVQTHQEDVYTVGGRINPASGVTIPATMASFSRKTKRRYRATPYGFGLEWNNFSAQRLAILAALGISKSRY